MAEKKDKKGEFSQKKNRESPVEVIEPIESKEIVRVTEVDRPLITAEQAKRDWQQYQDLINALIKQEDVVEIEGKLTIKKSGLNKVARFFGYSCEIIKAQKEEREGIQTVWKFKKGGGRYVAYQGPPFVWKIWAKAIAPNGRFRVAGAACSSTERDFAHVENDVMTTAETRAKKRAIWELTGMGEIELEENEEPEGKVESEVKQPTEQKPKTIERKTSIPGVTQVGIDPNAWKPMYPGVKYRPSDPKLRASKEAKDWILRALTDVEIDALSVIFMLGRKPNIREVKMDELTKGDTFDIICAIKKGELMKIIREIPEEPPIKSE